ncbi:MAG: ribosomal L7Ae/L30e/S12e/Gadd45 family protein [Lachnospiraceae bacterium]|nr:ribosomal L7Ae/L30e/S12e/Gadd45 family protein [Lachnospiraceae bacterium]
MKPDKVLQMLGMAQKAGAVGSGGFMTESDIKAGKAFLVVVASDSSDNTRKEFRDMCEHYSVPIRFYGSREDLGHCIGKEFRASLAVTNEGLARKILDLIDSDKLVRKDEVL